MKITFVGRVLMSFNKMNGTSKTGGSIFNILENLTHLMSPSEMTLICPLSDDSNGQKIMEDISFLNINFYPFHISKTPTITYVSQNEIDFQLYELEKEFIVDKIKTYTDKIKDSEIFVVDLQSPETIKYLQKISPKAIFVVVVSSRYLVNNLELISFKKSIIKFTRAEASSYCLHPIKDMQDCYEVEEILKRKGINSAIITLDRDGCFYFDNMQSGFHKAEVITDKKYFTAGDAFVSGMIYALRITKDISILAKQGIEKSANSIKKEINANFLKIQGNNK
ncbi:MAG: PfkB family carbohydrate kinase [Bacilli bacterium]|nr:PfkB family carbohydrate kinase [Bacilli bacterium]